MHRVAAFVGLVLSLLGGFCLSADAPTSPKPATPKVEPARQASGPAAKEPTAKEREEAYELQRLLVDTLDQIERNYVRPVDRRKLVEAAIRGALSELDPYSNYISPDEMDRFRTTVESEFGGIGIQVAVERGQLKVMSPLVGTPAYRAGIMAGDRIVEIDGKDTEHMDLDEVVRRLKGKAGTEVTLTVIHAGKTDKKVMKMARELIHVETVLGDHRNTDDTWNFMLDPQKRIAYVRITAFSRDTANELRRVMTALEKEKIRGLVLDLRFNPGGLLSTAVDVADEFVSQGRIVSTAGRNSPERVWEARKEGTFEGFPMVVLVNRYSASASEIVAACLQDHNRAVVAGERTWGKGSVQNVIELEYKPDDDAPGDGPSQARSALKLTTAGYRRPNGKNIDKAPDAKDADEWGVSPDKGLELKMDDDETFALAADRRARELLLPKTEASNPAGKPSETSTSSPAAKAGKGGPKEPGPSGRRPRFVDRQLQMALSYLTGELARAN